MNRKLLEGGFLLSPGDSGGDGGGSGTNAGISEDKVNDLINAAFTARLKRQKEELLKELTGDESPIMKKIGEITQSITASVDEIKKTTIVDSKKKSSKVGDEPEIPEELQTRLSQLEKTNEKLSKQLEQREQALQKKQEAETSAKRADIAKKALKEAGFDKRKDGVYALIRDKIKWNEADDDKPGTPMVDVDGNEVPLNDWVTKNYKVSDEGKAYLDALNTQGSGGVQGEHGNGSTSNLAQYDFVNMPEAEFAKTLELARTRGL
jgi:hypothetical protein